MNIYLGFVLVLSSIFFTQSCKSVQDAKNITNNTMETNTSMDLIQKPIKIKDVEGKKLFWIQTLNKKETKITPSPKQSYISFSENNKLKINSDCNLGSASYKLNNTDFSLGPIIATKRFCGDESTEQQLFENLYNTAFVYQIGNKIFFNSKDNSVNMEFEIKD